MGDGRDGASSLHRGLLAAPPGPLNHASVHVAPPPLGKGAFSRVEPNVAGPDVVQCRREGTPREFEAPPRLTPEARKS
jgi:hypothetical protein